MGRAGRHVTGTGQQGNCGRAGPGPGRDLRPQVFVRCGVSSFPAQLRLLGPASGCRAALAVVRSVVKLTATGPVLRSNVRTSLLGFMASEPLQASGCIGGTALGFGIGIGPRLFRVRVSTRGVRLSSGVGPFSVWTSTHRHSGRRRPRQVSQQAYSYRLGEVSTTDHTGAGAGELVSTTGDAIITQLTRADRWLVAWSVTGQVSEIRWCLIRLQRASRARLQRA